MKCILRDSRKGELQQSGIYASFWRPKYLSQKRSHLSLISQIIFSNKPNFQTIFYPWHYLEQLKKGLSYPCNKPWKPVGLLDVEASTFCLGNWLTDGVEVVSFTHRPPFTAKKIPGTYFCQSLSRPQNHSEAKRIRTIKKSNDLIGTRTRDLPACSIQPQPTTLPCRRINLWKILFFSYIHRYNDTPNTKRPRELSSMLSK
jgi:hypothetical protein